MRLRDAGLICLATLAACTRAPRQRVSLLDHPAAADLRRETIGVVLLSAANERNLLEGWSDSEALEPGKTAMWAIGDESALRFDLTRARPLDLHLAATPFPWTGRPQPRMELLLNGEPVETLPLRDGETTARVIPLPAEMLRPGENRLSFRHPWGKSPKSLGKSVDIRLLAVWFSELGLTPSGETLSSWKTAEPVPDDFVKLGGPDRQLFSYTFPLPKNARLQLHLVSTDSSLARLFVYQRLAGSTRPTQLMELEMSEEADKRKTIRLSGKPGEFTTVSFATEVEMTAFNRFKEIDLLGDGEMPGWTGSDLPAPAPAPSAVFAPPPKTIMIFLVDALRADHLPAYGYNRPTAPHLDAFARAAETYDDAWAVSSWTKPSVASILTGRPPEEHGAGKLLSVLNGEIPRAPELLKPRGYHTAAVIASPNVAAGFGFARGFDEFHDLTPADPHDAVSGRIVAQFRQILKERASGEPLFAYLHLTDPHSPYAPQRQYALFDRPVAAGRAAPPETGYFNLFARERLLSGVYDNPIDRYDAEILQADAAFGETLAALKEAGRLDDALILFVADHGEEFGDHGGAEHGGTLFSEVMRVPLLIRWPGGGKAGARNPGPASQLDLLPTLLRAAGAASLPLPGYPLDLPLPEKRSRDGSLLDGVKAASLRDGTWDYHSLRERGRYPGQPKEFLFDLSRDPNETHDLSGEQPLRAAWLRARLRARVARYKNGATVEAADPELLKKLKTLGYLH